MIQQEAMEIYACNTGKKMKAAGTSEGAQKGWDSRGRGRAAEAKSHGEHYKHATGKEDKPGWQYQKQWYKNSDVAKNPTLGRGEHPAKGQFTQTPGSGTGEKAHEFTAAPDHHLTVSTNPADSKNYSGKWLITESAGKGSKYALFHGGGEYFDKQGAKQYLKQRHGINM